MAGQACGCATRPGRRSLAPRRCIRRDGAGGLTAPEIRRSALRCCGVIRVVPLWAGEGRAPAFSKGRSGRKRARPATAPGNSFPPARTRAFAARSKRAAGRRPTPRCRPDGAPHATRRIGRGGPPQATCRWGPRGCRPAPPPAFGRHEGRGGRGLPNPEPPMLDDLLSPPVPADTDYDAGQAPSPAVHPLDELALYGCRPFQDDADPRPLPEPHAAEGAVAGALNALADLFCGTRLEDDLPDLFWSFVNLFHRKADRITRDLDDNEQAQRRSQAEQDGSEVKSVDLERLIAQGLTLTERRNAFEFLRDHAAEHYAAHTGSAWRPRSGSMVNHRTLTAAVIDSRDFLNAKRRAETEVLLPPGPRIAFVGGIDYNDHARIWAALDQVREKHPAMVLMHGGSPKGAERIAA